MACILQRARESGPSKGGYVCALSDAERQQLDWLDAETEDQDVDEDQEDAGDAEPQE